MKNGFLLIALCLSATVIISCEQNKANQVDDSMEQDSIIGADTCIEINTNAGYTIKEYLDKDGECRRMDLVWGDTEEIPFVIAGFNGDGEPNFVKYIYDEKGKLDGFVQFGETDYFLTGYEIMDGDEALSQQYNLDDSDTIDWREVMFDMIRNKDNGEKYFSRYYFKRDSLDRIIKVYDPIFFNSITADTYDYIVYEVCESEDFWAETLGPHKSQVNLIFYVIMESYGKQYIVEKHYGYMDARVYEDEMKEDYNQDYPYPEYKPKKQGKETSI